MNRFQQRLTVVLLALSAAATPAAASDSKAVDVVASFSILADMIRQVGGGHVEVTALVGRNSDTHTWSPTPAAAKAIATADLVVVNGLGFEGWLDRLIQAAGYDGPVVVASQGVEPLPVPANAHHHGHGHHHHHRHHEHAHPHRGGRHHRHHPGAYDPHAWHDVSNGIIYTRNIADALAQVDPEHAEVYRQQAQAYIDRLKALDATIHSMISALPQNRRTVVVPHNAFRYYGHAYGVEFLAPIGLSTAAAASAGELAALIRKMRAMGIDALFTENISDPRLMQQIARETDATIGGTLYSDALSEINGPASTYVEMLRYNTKQLVRALRQQKPANDRSGARRE